MKVKLLTSMAGIMHSHNAGDVIDCNEAEAKRLIERNQAEPVADRGVETAVKKPRTRKAAPSED